MLDEAAGLIRSLYANDRTTHAGEYFRTEDASMIPGPVNGTMPILAGTDLHFSGGGVEIADWQAEARGGGR